MRPHLSLAAAPLLLGLALTGCSGGGGGGQRVPVFPVSGKVTFNNAPVAGATVSFSPNDKQPAAFGQTNDQGEYTLTTYETGDGAAAGSYTVLVTKVAASAAASPAGASHEQAYKSAMASGAHSAKSGQQGGSLLPAKYSQATTSDLKVTVKEGGDNKIDLDLKP